MRDGEDIYITNYLEEYQAHAPGGACGGNAAAYYMVMTHDS